MRFNRFSNLRSFNNALTVLVVGLGLYITAMPFLPYLDLWIKELRDSTDGYVYRGQLAANNIDESRLAAPPEDNRLVIPAIQIDNKIIEDQDPTGLSLGIWHRPHTSTPDQGGNTVFVGHRFSYDSPATFYHLDKLKLGDQFAVWWQKTEYVYEVDSINVVDPYRIEIEENTDAPIVTLYTCTPVWTAKDRLVITARLVNPGVLNGSGETPEGATQS